MMRGTRNSDSLARHNIRIFLAGGETMLRIDAQIHFVMPIRDLERLRQFSRAGTELMFVIDPTPLFH